MGRKKGRSRSRSFSGSPNRKKNTHRRRGRSKENKRRSRSSSSERRDRQDSSSGYNRRKHRRGSSRERSKSPRYQTHSKSRDRRSRSRSYDGRRHGKSHGGRHGHSRSTSRDRSSRQSRKRSRDRRKGKGRRSKSTSSDSQRSHSQSYSRGGREKASEHENEMNTDKAKVKSSITKEIPGYSNMTPAERVRAKIKVMLDKSVVSLSEKKDDVAASDYVPTPAQREMIESESFETANFVSHRTASREASNGKDILMTPQSSRHERDVDPGEFEPQVVELPLMASVEEEEGVVAEETKSRKESGTIKKELTEEERTELWIKRLQKMREDYLSSMTEEERVKFLKCLEL